MLLEFLRVLVNRTDVEYRYRSVSVSRYRPLGCCIVEPDILVEVVFVVVPGGGWLK